MSVRVENGGLLIRILFAFLVLALACFVYYFLIFSPIQANNPTIISLRQAYLGNVYKLRKLIGLGDSDNCAYFFQPILTDRINSKGLKYTYRLSGKLISVGPSDNTIMLRCSNGNTYKLSVGMRKAETGGYYTLVWDDNRTLSQIYRDMKGNPSKPVNIEGTEVLGLIR